MMRQFWREEWEGEWEWWAIIEAQIHWLEYERLDELWRRVRL